MKLFALFLGIGAATCLSAASFDQASSCSITPISPGQAPISQSGSPACYIADGASNASASSSGSIQVLDVYGMEIPGQYLTPNTPFTQLSVSLAANGQVKDQTDPTTGANGGIPQAASSISLLENLETGGPTRQGYLAINWITWPNGTSDQGWGDMFSLSIGPASASCSIGTQIPLSCGSLSVSHLNLIPVTLGSGQVFTLNVADQASSTTVPQFGSDQIAANESVTIQFLEADRSTPVTMYDPPVTAEAPEPGTVGLLSLAALAGIPLWKRKRS